VGAIPTMTSSSSVGGLAKPVYMGANPLLASILPAPLEIYGNYNIPIKEVSANKDKSKL